MASLIIPNTFIAGTPALASEVNANFQAIVSWTQGQISTDNIGILGARSIALPSSPTLAILSIAQTASQIGLNISNSGTDTAVAISQSGSLATGKAALLINSPSTQLNANAAELLMTLAANSTIPALLIKHGSVETLSTTKNELDLFDSAVEISAARVKLPVRTATQRNSVSQEGSVLYNTDTDQLNVRRSDAWIPVESPVGSVQMYAVDSAPEGWLLCNGQAVSRTIYAKLFAVLSTTYGSGDGSTTFNVPNLVGIFPRGSQMGGITTQTIGGETFNAQVRATTQRDSTAVNGLSDSGHTHAVNTTDDGYRIMTALHGPGGNNHETTYDESPERPVKSWTSAENPPIAAKSASANLTSSDTETRPANISLAFIIKY